MKRALRGSAASTTGWRPARMVKDVSSTTAGQHHVPPPASSAQDCRMSMQASAAAMSGSAVSSRIWQTTCVNRCRSRRAAFSAACAICWSSAISRSVENGWRWRYLAHDQVITPAQAAGCGGGYSIT
ncbi:hypothetical protein RAA17_08045 [Komagataeibacter rhaeticus]|nr:hypothetical protein [Komagataeibacter rhaeticus]